MSVPFSLSSVRGSPCFPIRSFLREVIFSSKFSRALLGIVNVLFFDVFIAVSEINWRGWNRGLIGLLRGEGCRGLYSSLWDEERERGVTGAEEEIRLLVTVSTVFPKLAEELTLLLLARLSGGRLTPIF